MTTHWPRPDFLAPRRRVPALAWVWAATGALVLAVSVTEAVLMQQTVAAQGAQLVKARQHLAKVTPARPDSSLANRANVNPRSVDPRNVDPSGDAEAIRAAQRVLAQLAHPWGQILATVEAETPAGLQWLLLDHASDNPDLRFEGQAPDVSAALQVVDGLSMRPGWSGVALTRLQAPDLPAPRGAVAVVVTPANWRFEITAAVNAQRVAAPSLGAGG